MLAVLALLVPSLAPSLAPSQDVTVERKGAHFTLRSHLPQESLADEALAAAEAAWPLALEALGLKEKKLATPLVIHLYPDAVSYEAAEQSLTGGAFKANLAFSHFATKTTHIALQPPTSPQALKELGLPTLTAYLLAHEAAHLATYAYQENALDFPEWLAEGMAVHVGVGAMTALGRMRPGESEPFHAKSAVRCQKLLVEQKLPQAAQVLAAEIGDLDFHDRYAVSHRFYAFLRAEHAKDLEKTVKSIRIQGGGEAYRAGLMAELGRQWKDKELEKLHKEWLASVQAAKPEWDETFRSLETRGEGYVQRGFTDTNAVAFRTEGPKTLPLTASGTVRVVPGDSHQMNFLLGRHAKGFLSVAFNFGHGVSVFRYEAGAKEEWKTMASAECPDLRIGADVPFRIEAEVGELAIFVADKEVLRAPLERSPLGPWGLGAQAKTVGEWKSIVVASTPKEGAKD